MPQHFSFSRDFDILWRTAASEILKSTQPDDLRESVLRLSDFFIQESGGATPWQERWALKAYTLYFHPLNYLRARRAIRKAHERGFFARIQTFVDWGCGLGALTRALRDELPRDLTRHLTVVGVDQSQEVLTGFLRWNEKGFHRIKAQTPEKFARDFAQPWEQTCLGLSYSLNELKSFDILARSPEAILLLEPSTFGLARNLQNFRAEALASGYYAWSPCPHQQGCPLLTKSRKDWCFDRLHLEMPELWDELFSELPIKNKTVTLSHMALSKTPLSQRPHSEVRLVGDDLKEKGKIKWLACAGEQKFFLVWLTKWGKAPKWKRGDLLEVPPEFAADFARGGEIKMTPAVLELVRCQAPKDFPLEN